MLSGVSVDVTRALPGRPAVVARVVLCVLAVTPLLRWAVVAHSVRAGRPWRRSCPRCGTPVGPAGSLGSVAPTARCGVCRQRLGPPPWTLELLTIVAAAALVWARPAGWQLAGYAWWAALGVVLLFVDLAVQRLPARLSYAAAGGLLILLAVDAMAGQGWQPWTRAVLGALATAAVIGLCALLLPGLVGWGDVRYALAIGAAATWVSWLALYAAAFLSTLAAALVGLGLIAGRKATFASHLALGPFLFGGTLAAVTLLSSS